MVGPAVPDCPAESYLGRIINTTRSSSLLIRIFRLFGRLLVSRRRCFGRRFRQFAFTASHRGNPAFKSPTFITRNSGGSRSCRTERCIFFELANHRIEFACGRGQISLHSRRKSLNRSFIDLNFARKLFGVSTNRGQLPLRIFKPRQCDSQGLLLLIRRRCTPAKSLKIFF